MENEELEGSCDEKISWEVHLQDINGDGRSLLSDKAPKVQLRKHVTKARWDGELGMAEIIEREGSMWTTTGIIRGSNKLYCSIEETLFLVELGALLLMDANETILSLKNMYEMIAEEKNGCCWESYKAFKHLKSLGYIVKRHGISWTLKSDKCCSISTCSQGNQERDESSSEKGEEYLSINNRFGDMQISGLRPAFDVYHPNSKFKKSDPGVPYFVLCLARDPPSTAEFEDLRRRCNGVRVIICNVEHGHVSFFSFTRIELDVLP
ncbi:hypothetical protein AQUCO_02000252v1 [Aquilegia coerulea]|uniref:tRNA-splicing endonuclease subunit Sen54 N-terminal domain-containing protein n=1 Tax=Aquilegia coerulea TaxID=218851 RepID=A0A2G5DGP7_AQUCA|nr:hypothetical protein AQUCO_02000252v1 [Aquilegia coerulea]